MMKSLIIEQRFDKSVEVKCSLGAKVWCGMKLVWKEDSLSCVLILEGYAGEAVGGGSAFSAFPLAFTSTAESLTGR